jgi:nicotinate-nucleotide adenylyltransferase
MSDHKKIAVFGGSFNPPHLGHAAAIQTLERAGAYDEIWVMPSGDRHDKQFTVSGVHRLEMVRIMCEELFTKSAAPVKISSLELERPSLTTTYETMQALEKLYPSDEFYFVVGSDVVGNIKDKWVNGEQLYVSARFILIDRLLRAPDASAIPPHTTVLFNVAPDAVRSISSTAIRMAIQEKSEWAPLVTPGVAEYIQRHRLYMVQ